MSDIIEQLAALIQAAHVALGGSGEWAARSGSDHEEGESGDLSADVLVLAERVVCERNKLLQELAMANVCVLGSANTLGHVARIVGAAKESDPELILNATEAVVRERDEARADLDKCAQVGWYGLVEAERRRADEANSAAHALAEERTRAVVRAEKVERNLKEARREVETVLARAASDREYAQAEREAREKAERERAELARRLREAEERQEQEHVEKLRLKRELEAWIAQRDRWCHYAPLS